jgi:hypothetical protein
MTNTMKYAFIISLIVLQSLTVQAQAIARNDVPSIELRSNIAPSSTISGALERSSYSVILIQNKKNSSFEVISPKADKAEVKLMSDGGSEICVIHKGMIKSGKNLFTLPTRKIGRGIYYVVSKLSSGEQFADRIVVEK